MLTYVEISGKINMQAYICNMHISTRKYSTLYCKICYLHTNFFGFTELIYLNCDDTAWKSGKLP